MISQMLFSFKVFLIKLSPITWLDSYFLQKQRKRAYTKALEERIYILRLEQEKLSGSMIQYSTKWKNHDKQIKVDIAKLSRFRFSDEIMQNIADNFLLFLRKLNYSNDLEVKISGLEKVISKIVDMNKQSQQKTIQSPNKSLVHYRTILDRYLAKTQDELKYWKLQSQKEVLEENMQVLVARLKNFKATSSYPF
jgi:hypothetical protein